MADQNEDQQYVEIQASAAMCVPPGSVVSGPSMNELVLPNGERYKFWVSVEMVQNSDGDAVELDMDTRMLSDRDMVLEHNGSVVDLEFGGLPFTAPAD